MKNNKQLLILFLLIVIFLIVRSQLLYFNLPVCANIDERQSLRLLFHFNNVELNPQFFRYPALYYYITYFFIKIFGNPTNILFVGRLLNLLIGGGIAVVTYQLASTIFNNRNIGLLAGLFTLISPIIVDNCSYIITDPLLTLFSLLALLYLYKFFEDDQSIKSLMLMTLFIGFAIATKYTAILLIIVYLIYEIKTNFSISSQQNRSQTLLSSNLKSAHFSIITILLGLIILFTLVFVPKDIFSSLLIQGGNINSEITTTDIDFIDGFLAKLSYVGIGLIILGIISAFKLRAIRRLYRIRIYFVILLSLIIFIVFNPYIMASLNQFLYDFGAELKANQFAGNERQFINYFKIYFNRESIVLMIFFFIGLYYAVKKKKHISVLLIYLIIHYLIIGSATRGYERYLTPILPIMFSISAFGIFSLNRLIKSKIIFSTIFFLIIGLVFIDNYLWLKPILGKKYHHDDLFDSYHYILENNIENVYYSGYIPDIELKMKGINTIQIAEQNLIEDYLSKMLDNNSALIVNRPNYYLLKINDHSLLQMVKSYDSEYGQYIYKIN